MKCRGHSCAVVSLFSILLALSVGPLVASEAGLASPALAAAQASKQRCITTCRARYRDCRRLNQLLPSECRSVYRDCARYSCTGLGPG